MSVQLSYILLVAGVVVAGFSQVLLKKGAMQEHSSLLREYFNPFVISGYLLMFVSVFLNMCGIRGVSYLNGPMVESLGCPLVLLLSFLFFKEKITCRKLAGVGCIVAGMIIFYL